MVSHRLGASLAWVGIAVHDPDDIATKLARDFGLARSDTAFGGDDPRSTPTLQVGRCAINLLPVGEGLTDDMNRPGLHHLGLRTDDLDATVSAATAAGFDTSHLDVGIGGKPAVALNAAQLGGIRAYLIEAAAPPDCQADAIERIDHIGVASADNAPVLDTFCRRLGFALESQQTDLEVGTAVESFSSDKYGVVRHSRPAEPVGGLRVAFVTVGDCELEFLQNFDPAHDGIVDHGARGTTRQDQGAISRYIASRGAGLHHLALKVRDIDGLLTHLAGAGYEVIDPVGRPGSRRARIGFIHPRSLGGILVHFVERSELAAGD